MCSECGLYSAAFTKVLYGILSYTGPHYNATQLYNPISWHMMSLGHSGVFCEVALRWMLQNTFKDKSTLVQVKTWCCQAISLYLSQCWPRSLWPYGVTRSQCVHNHTVVLCIVLVISSTLHRYLWIIIGIDHDALLVGVVGHGTHHGMSVSGFGWQLAAKPAGHTMHFLEDVWIPIHFDWNLFLRVQLPIIQHWFR